ncbi:MAG TPA: hypothetical protein VEB19_10260 [Gemmatimonadaceae bacterium]|nr:hypothetical protein [Gemmatimonadaceae bacterium]
MAELLVSFTEPTRSTTGDLYYGRAYAKQAGDGLWEGWLEFTRAGGDGSISTPRETEQPNRDDVMYWAQGLTATYLEGALERALRPAAAHPPRKMARRFATSGPRRSPARGTVAVRTRVVLDPFLTYAEGEQLLRSQLHALSHDHLQNIVEAYGFTDESNPDWARGASDDDLVEHIVNSVRKRLVG